ncbi:response regulator [bacterium]|nr:response regulator [bacterium]
MSDQKDMSRTDELRALRDSEIRYRALFDQANDAIFLLRGEVFADCNEKTLEMFGCTREQIIGQPPYRFSPPKQADGRDSIEKATEKILATFAGKPQRFEWLHSRYDGTVFDAEVSLSDIEISGEHLLHAIVSDISERKSLERVQTMMLSISRTAHSARGLEELLEATRDELSELIDTRNFFATLHDPTTNTYAFECFYDEKDQLELHVPRAADNSMTDYVCRSGKPLLVTESEFCELSQREGVHSGGTTAKSWLGVPLRTQHGVIGVVVVQSYDREDAFTTRELKLMTFVAENLATAVERLRDEDERFSLELRIRQAQKFESIGVLAGGIAHDFNNLLTGIIGNADLALLELLPSSPATPSLEEIKAISRRASDLCRQILAYSGRAAVDPEPLDLSREVEQMQTMLNSMMPHEASLSVNSPGPIAVNADAAQIAQVIRNVVTNAFEAVGDEPGDVSVRDGTVPLQLSGLADARTDVSRDRAAVDSAVCPYVEVVDTGCGMDENTRRRVFEPFFSTKFTGRGLGLAAAHGIMRSHGGSINIKSEPGVGTSVRIVFPPCPQGSPARDAGETRPTACSEAVPLSILLVDDEDVVRRVGESLLGRAGYDVTTAADGRTAIDFFSEHAGEIACVVLDLTMPDMDGDEVLHEMRAIRSDIPILIASGYTGDDVAQRFEGVELSGFLQKPFSSESLLAEVTRIARAHGHGPSGEPHAA